MSEMKAKPAPPKRPQIILPKDLEVRLMPTWCASRTPPLR